MATLIIIFSSLNKDIFTFLKNLEKQKGRQNSLLTP
jgi:hypothetical protein